jgi:hypothetical protein
MKGGHKMSNLINDIFQITSKTYSARATSKVGVPASIPTTSSAEPAKGDIDKVTLSQLAQSLKGAENLNEGKQTLSSLLKDETGKIFNSLNKQDQDLLQSLFDQGSASAQDIELALQASANTVISLRANAERPRSAEEIATEKEYTELYNLSTEYNAAIAAATEIEIQASEDFHYGKISEDQLNNLKIESKKQIDELNSMDKYNNIHEITSDAYEKSSNAFSSAFKEFLGGNVNSSEQQSARSKLNDLGFGGPSVNRALKTYAYQRDSLAVIR